MCDQKKVFGGEVGLFEMKNGGNGPERGGVNGFGFEFLKSEHGGIDAA